MRTRRLDLQYLKIKFISKSHGTNIVSVKLCLVEASVLYLLISRNHGIYGL